MATLHCFHTGKPRHPALIFIHGLGGHPVDTWRSPHVPADNFWLHWIGRDTGCPVWSVGYDAELCGWRGQAMPLPDQATQISDLLATEPELDGRNLVLIGHSMGGLVIKHLLIQGATQGDARMKALVGRVVALSFIATPHSGSQLASLAKAVRLLLRTNEQVGNLAAHEPHLAQLNRQFRAAQYEKQWPVRVFAERHDVQRSLTLWKWRIPLPGVRVVNPTSSDPGLPGVTAIPMGGDHFSICKPADSSEHIHKSLCTFIRELDESSRTSAPAPTPCPSPPRDAALVTPPAEPGRLNGPGDNRLQPRDGRFYGRERDVDQILAFLNSAGDAALVTAREVAGVGGIGKTEVCKAALKAWLGAHPDQRAYFVELPDYGGLGDLIATLSHATGLTHLERVEDLLPALPDGLYYLDNLEGVSARDDGVSALRSLVKRPGLRLLVSSRVSLHSVFGKPLLIDVLPSTAALRLFRELWSGDDPLPDDSELARFVVDHLGAHALSLTLIARLGDCYPYPDLVRRWHAEGVRLAQDPQDPSRLGSLPISLNLTAQALAGQAASLHVWTIAALFSGGLPDMLLQALETQTGWEGARPPLVRHHILHRHGDSWQILPPLARFALEASLRGESGFDWLACRPGAQSLFNRTAAEADAIASTEQALTARRWLIRHFAPMAHLMLHDMRSDTPDRAWLTKLNGHLINQYQFQPVLARDVLTRLAAVLDQPASALQALGDLESRLGRPDEARRLYEQALELFVKEQDGLGQANTLKALGDLLQGTSAFLEAMDLYLRALALYQREQEPMGTAYTLAELARCQHARDDPAGRDLALRAAFAAAATANVESVLGYVVGVLKEVTGSEAEAREWLERHLGSDT